MCSMRRQKWSASKVLEERSGQGVVEWWVAGRGARVWTACGERGCVLHDKQAGMVTGVDMGVSCASITK